MDWMFAGRPMRKLIDAGLAMSVSRNANNVPLRIARIGEAAVRGGDDVQEDRQLPSFEKTTARRGATIRIAPDSPIATNVIAITAP